MPLETIRLVDFTPQMGESEDWRSWGLLEDRDRLEREIRRRLLRALQTGTFRELREEIEWAWIMIEVLEGGDP